MISSWSVPDVNQWLVSTGYGIYAPAFLENQIDGAVLLSLTSQDLREELKVHSLLDRKNLLVAIESLRNRVVAAAAQTRNGDGFQNEIHTAYTTTTPSITTADTARYVEDCLRDAKDQQAELEDLLREAERIQQRAELESRMRSDRGATPAIAPRPPSRPQSAAASLSSSRVTDTASKWLPSYTVAGTQHTGLDRRTADNVFQQFPPLSKPQSTCYKSQLISDVGPVLEDVRLSYSPLSRTFNKKLDWQSLLIEQENDLDRNPLSKGLKAGLFLVCPSSKHTSLAHTPLPPSRIYAGVDRYNRTRAIPPLPMDGRRTSTPRTHDYNAILTQQRAELAANPLSQGIYADSANETRYQGNGGSSDCRMPDVRFR